MKKKIVYFSVVCGSALLLLVFLCEAFSKQYPYGRLKNPMLADGILFVVLYWLSIFSYFLFFKKVHKSILYVAIPLLHGVLLFIVSDLRHGKLRLRELMDFPYFYLIFVWLAAGIFAWLVDLLVSYMVRRKEARQETPCQ